MKETSEEWLLDPKFCLRFNLTKALHGILIFYTLSQYSIKHSIVFFLVLRVYENNGFENAVTFCLHKQN